MTEIPVAMDKRIPQPPAEEESPLHVSRYRSPVPRSVRLLRYAR